MNSTLASWPPADGGSGRALPDSQIPASGRRALRLLERLAFGSLHLQLPDGSVRNFPPGRSAATGPTASLHLHDWKAVERALRGGDIGFAEAYLDGQWSSEDPVAVLEFFLVNRAHVERVIYGSPAGRLLYLLRHALRRNSRAGSRRNIHAHYDLGNDFYRLWLDDTMSYSSALYAGAGEETLEQAQVRKIRRALDEAGVKPGDRVLEIGCGWGALAQIAARDYGAQVTGVTLSTEQLDFARARVQAAGLAGRCDLRLMDYRDLPREFAGRPFDAVISIEMFEAVGEAYWDGFFRTVAALLKPGARVCLQSITIRDDLFARYRRSTDFIQQYIFPGGLLPSRQAFAASAARNGLETAQTHAFGADYARTLQQWRAVFHRRLAQVRELGFDERFVRLWDFYLAYCIASFSTGNTDVAQFTLARRS